MNSINPELPLCVEAVLRVFLSIKLHHDETQIEKEIFLSICKVDLQEFFYFFQAVEHGIAMKVKLLCCSTCIVVTEKISF